MGAGILTPRRQDRKDKKEKATRVFIKIEIMAGGAQPTFTIFLGWRYAG
jgi:hypothetical protein